MYQVVGQVKKHNMLMELAPLPVVESASDPHATSGASAADVWQIIPSTGCNYGLKQTCNYDARRNVVASTTVTLNMMWRLNRVFDSGWLLTIAIYSNGESWIMKTIKTSKARGKSMDFWSLPLPQETKQYVPKMLALSDIFESSRCYSVRLSTTNEGRALARVHLSSPVKVAKIVDMAGISISKLETFNAGVKGFMLDTSGPQYVMMPKKHADQLRESLASGETATIQSMLAADNTPLNSRVYTVRSGNILSSIASHLDVSIRDLQQQNKLHGSKLKPGQNLTIGAGSSAQRLVNDSNNITYHVRKGDSLPSIAKRCDVNVKDVTRWSNGTANLQPGDKLMLFVKNNNVPDS